MLNAIYLCKKGKDKNNYVQGSLDHPIDLLHDIAERKEICLISAIYLHLICEGNIRHKYTKSLTPTTILLSAMFHMSGASLYLSSLLLHRNQGTIL